LNLPSDTIIDREIVALDQAGKPSFDLLQGFGRRAPSIVLYAFDLLMLRGKDVQLWPLEERREQLREIVTQLPDTVRYSETFDVPLPDLILAVSNSSLKGLLSSAQAAHTAPASAVAIGSNGAPTVDRNS
jgi:bifunctional non-homologous end joining protein LigD